MSPLADGLAVHPSWPRFARTLSGDERVLVIRARRAAGRALFARSWLAGDEGRIVDQTLRGREPVCELVREIRRSDGSPGRTVLIVDANAVEVEPLAEIDWAMASPQDLSLTLDETLEVADGRRADAEEAARIHEFAGGWLEPILELLDGRDRRSVRSMVMPGLANWVASHPAGWGLAKAAFVPELTVESLEHFFDEVRGPAPSLDDLEEAGLVVPAGDGAWRMPELTRSALQELVRLDDPGLARELTGAGVSASARGGSLMRTVEYVFTRRDSNLLGRLMLSNWADVLTTDGRLFGRLMARLPKAVAASIPGGMNSVLSQTVFSLGDDRLEWTMPSERVPFASDRTAEALRGHARRLYRRPSSLALTVGLLELTHLRLTGHFVPGIAAARSLRSAVAGTEVGAATPALLGFAELQAGMSLHLAGRCTEAEDAYADAVRYARRVENHFIMANATANLALLSAQRGDNGMARRWLGDHEESIGQVGWGRKMVARGAILARAFNARVELDVTGMGRILAELPEAPDADEFWGVHAHLLALHAIFDGRREDADALVRDIRRRRGHLISPLAEQMLDLSDASIRAAAGQPSGFDPATASSPELKVLIAVSLMKHGHVDRAAQVLAEVSQEPLGLRWRRACEQLQALVTGRPGDVLRRLLVEVAAGRGELTDVFVIGGDDPELVEQHLGAEALRRLQSMPQLGMGRPRIPQLTEREREVLAGLREGLSRNEIAAAQHRSPNTVKTQMRSLYAKLRVSSRDEALSRAREFGF